MAITQNTFNGDGSNLGPFSFTFKWLEPTDIKVTVSGVLKTAGTHYNLQSLNYATKSGGQVLFTAGNAPAVGTGNIVVYRQTDDSDLSATFNSGSAIRAQDLNDNFIQGLYVTQESSNNATTAISTAEGAVTTANAATATANSAVSTANAATATANTAASDAAAAVSTANTASTNASAAVATANTASTNASAAVSTANSAAADAATAISTANGAVSTANSAAADAATAISTANGAVSTANSAVTTANAAAADATAAVATANTADTNASAAVSTANAASSTATSADNKADQAIAAVANALLFDIVANVAAIPASPADGDAVEITDATGIESFTPLSGLPSGFIGDSGLGVRLIYQSAGSTWIWLQYFPQDPDNRYAGPNTAAGTAAAPSIAFGPTDTNTGIYSPGADELALVTGGTARLTADASGSINIPGSITTPAISSGLVGVTTSVSFIDQTDPTYAVSITPSTGATANITYTLPDADGTNGQLLSTDGSGNLSWTNDVGVLVTDGGNFDNGTSTVSTSQTLDGGQF